jgi:hypothetical protein
VAQEGKAVTKKLLAKMKADMKIALAADAREAFQVAAKDIILERCAAYRKDDPTFVPTWTISGRIYDDLVMPLLLKARKKS